MAITQRTRMIANPARRKSRRNAPRKLSLKQRAIFGRTPAIRSAAKAALTRKRANGVRKSHRRRNPVDHIVGFSLANPARRKAGKMAAPKKRRRSKSRRVNRSRRNPARRSNPKHHSYGHRRRSTRRRANRRRNPSYMIRRVNRRRRNPGGMGSLTGIVTNAVFVIVGALGSKLGAQLILGSNNVGWVGYLGNAAVGLGLWFLTEHVMKNKEASSGVIAGTVVEVLLRIINDMTPFGQYVSGLGMGDYQMQSFVTPQVLVDPYNNAQIQLPNGWAPQTIVQAPAAPASGMGYMYGDTYTGPGTYGS
jgi:hypothetical protein